MNSQGRVEVKVGVHAHVFYPDLWPEVASCIDNIVAVCGAANVLIVVTYPESVPILRVEIEKRTFGYGARIVGVPNRGYDVGPFVCEFINKVDLDAFDLIVKLHTKRNVDTWLNFRPLKGASWRKMLLSFCSSRKEFERVVFAFAKYSRLGYVTKHRLVNYCGSDLHDQVEPVCRMLRDEYSLCPQHMVTISGTMFCARAKLLKCFQGRYAYEDFVLVDRANAHKDYGLAAQLEFAFTLAADAMGYLVSEGRFPVRFARFGYAMQSAAYLSLRAFHVFLRSVFRVTV